MAAGHAGIGGVYFAGFGKAHAGEQGFEAIGFFPFAGAAVVRPQGGNGGQFALQVDDHIALAVEAGKQGVSHRGSGQGLRKRVGVWRTFPS